MTSITIEGKEYVNKETFISHIAYHLSHKYQTCTPTERIGLLIASKIIRSIK